jgi:hypothetical protein
VVGTPIRLEGKYEKHSRTNKSIQRDRERLDLFKITRWVTTKKEADDLSQWIHDIDGIWPEVTKEAD